MLLFSWVIILNMLTFEEIEDMLSDIADELPEEVFTKLNGGVILLPETKRHPESGLSGELFIMGEYHHQPMGLGRYVAIYYGSFMALYARLDPVSQREKLRDILRHELIHHLESLAGERDLEKQDALEMEMYRRGIRKYKFKKHKS